ncbi:Sugar ABC transporter substrate-binding protein [Rhodovastum atsumiense]|uniref:Sugar ABC transporter substrate-binding protein n=1 Tax=Rhodovastum atsumiense TaxID=504468 RepID=A0A5M6IS20_9PROT|nr:substrate-binding domain-containing protein [Rhodovastum atsumiense]KAA5610687.1 sugar ABC transporter substrate-binding protein [Rhodovastum atsumiense]CAH2603314.1 Sugar ABC transporter substrate-binding protein [Rhodovastum atsumiense]
MKKFLLAACGLAALACASTAGAAEMKKVRIAVLMYGNKAEFVQLMQRYGREHPAVTSGKADITFYDGRYDASVQNDQAQLAINNKVDAIIVNPMDFDANIDVVTKAKAAKIPVVVTNARLNTQAMNAEVVSDDVLGGYLEAKDVLKKLGCKGNVVIIEGPKGGSGEIQRGQGNEKAIAECPAGAVKVLERKTANWSRAEAYDLMQNWLVKHRGRIQGVIGQNDEMALGAIEAIKASGQDVNKYAIAGIDGVSDALRAVKAGEMTSILQDAKGQMQGSIDVAMRAVLGPDYQPMSPIWAQYGKDMPWNDGQSKRYDVPWTIVTPANADALLEARK